MEFSFSSRRDPRTHDAIVQEAPVQQGGVVKEQRSNQIWHLCLLDVLIAAHTSANSTTRRRRKQRDPHLERGSFLHVGDQMTSFHSHVTSDSIVFFCNREGSGAIFYS